MAAHDLVSVGVIVGAHGIRGEVKLKSFTSDPDSIGRYGSLQDTSGQSFEITRMRPARDGFIAMLKGTSDRNQAELLRGRELYVPRDRLPPLEKSQSYAHDLLGADVLLENGERLGKLVGIPNFGAGDLLEVERPGERETLLIPFTQDFVPQDDFSQHAITVVLPEGYLDEGQSP